MKSIWQICDLPWNNCRDTWPQALFCVNPFARSLSPRRLSKIHIAIQWHQEYSR